MPQRGDWDSIWVERLNLFTFVNYITKYVFKNQTIDSTSIEDRTMTDRKTLEAALVTLEAQRDILGDEVVDTSIAAIQNKLAQLTVTAVPSSKMVSVLFVVSLPSDQTEPALLTGHIQRCIERHHGQHLMVDEQEQIAIFHLQTDSENVVENAIRAAQAIQVTPQAQRATYSLIPPMQIAIQTVVVREGIVEPHDFLAHLQTPLHTVRAVLQQAKSSYVEQDRTILLVSAAAYSFAQGTVNVGETLHFDGQDWFVVEDFSEISTPYGRLYTRNIVPRLIERQSELELMQSSYRQTLAEGKCRVISIVGVLGVGKTRLLTEYEVWLDLLIERLWYFKGQANNELSATPYGLFRTVIQHRLKISDYDLPETTREKLVNGITGLIANFPEEDALIVGHLLGFDIGTVPLPARIHVEESKQREILFPIIGRFFREIAQLKNNVLSLILEDLQWADLGSLRLLEYIVESCHDVPLICVCTMRPTLFEQVSDWTTRIDNTGATHHLIELRSMSEASMRQMLNSVLRQHVHVSDASTQLMVRRAAGNPFQLEELVLLLIEEEIIDTSVVPWRFDDQQFAAIETPTTLMSLVQARLFSLSPDERISLQRAAAIGNQFWDSAVEYLHKFMALGVIGNTGSILRALEQKRLILRTNEVHPEFGVEYRFVHPVWQTVAYDSLPQQALQALHSALSQWYIGQGLDRSGNNTQLVARHFELAGDRHRAVKWYGMAGRKAQNSHKPTIAVGYYQHALDLLQAEDDDFSSMLQLFVGLGETLTLLARYLDAASLYSAMCSVAESIGDLTAQATAWNRLVDIEINRSDTESAMNCAIQAMNKAELAGDTGRFELATAWYHIGYVYLSRQHAYESEEWLRKSLLLSETLGTHGLTARIEKSFGHFSVLQNAYIDAISYFQRSLERLRYANDVTGVCSLLTNLAEVFRRQGDYNRARDLLQEALQGAEETRSRRDIVYCLNDLAGINTLQDQYLLAISQLEQVLKMTLPNGWWGIVGTYRYLTQAHLGLGENAAAHETALLTFEWAERRQLMSDLGVAWRILGMASAVNGDSIIIAEQSYTPVECFEKSCTYLDGHDTGELAETYRVWADYEFDHENLYKGNELWQRAGQCFGQIGAAHILGDMNNRRNFT